MRPDSQGRAVDKDASEAPTDATPVNVICMKWGDLYGPDYVNNLFNGVKRHLSLPHRFVCLTDSADGLDPGIEHFPLPGIDIPEGELDLRWRKLTVFKTPLFDLEGTGLFLDLDVVITGSLDDFFSYPGEFLIIRDDNLALPKPFRWLNPARARRLWRVGNSSVFRFQIGTQPQILEHYLSDPAAVIEDQPNFREQEFLTEEINDQDILDYWPKSWCVSYKYHCVPNLGTGFLADPVLPEQARIIIFAGSLSIPDAIAGRSGHWYRRLGPAPWLANAWQERTTDS